MMGVCLTDEELAGRVVAGVDTHAETHWLCVLDENRRVALSGEYPATAAGYAALADAIGEPGGCAAVGVEGTCSYGAGLADELRARGFRVLEVLRPKRDRRMLGEGKDDGIDAERAARDVLSGKWTSVPKRRGGWVEGLRAMLVARDRCVKSKVESLAAARSIVSTAPDGQRRRWDGMSADALMSALLGLGEDGASAMDGALLALARVWEAARKEADALEREMRDAIERNCPAIMAIYCCGAVSAANLVVSAGENAGRFGTEARFAKHCGVAPIPASSGKTSGRMRLNRGGDRRANMALHEIVIRRMHSDEETKEYVERRCAGRRGLSKKEAIRCLKRYVAREVWRALTHPFDVPKPDVCGQELRESRLMAGMRQRDVATVLGISVASVSKVERGKASTRSKSYKTYVEWFKSGMPVDVENSRKQEPGKEGKRVQIDA